MDFRCPACQYRITPKAPPRPGRYTPICPRCSAQIILTVPTDTNAEWRSAIPFEGFQRAGAPQIAAVGAGLAAAAGIATEVTPDFRSPPPTMACPVPHTPPPPTDSPVPYTPPPIDENSPPIYSPDPDLSAEASPTDLFTEDEKPTTVFRRRRPVPLPDVTVPNALGRYEVIRKLGRGGMGTVFLARQVSFDRRVTLKVMYPQWARDPDFVARFTREAYAASQLVHQNLVPIHDIGADDGFHYFSTEYVESRSLGDVLAKEGRSTSEAAIAYCLQAARGLKYAHDRGMVHGDIKPDNLVINAHGVVKVADLGLVIAPDSPAADDPRDDVYSLGCTLYALITGKPPLSGPDAFDVENAYATELPEPISTVSADVNAVILKALSRDPDERHQSMAELIADLERLLPGQGGLKPGDDTLETLADSVRRFQAVPLGKLRRTLVPAYFIGSLVATVIGLLAGGGIVTAVIAALAVETALAYFVIDGLTRKSYLFRRVREWFLGAGTVDWALTAVGLIAVLLVLWGTGLLWVSLVTAVLAGSVAFVFHSYIDRGLDGERKPAVGNGERLVRRLRLKGWDEDAVRRLVAKYADRDWEEFFEAVFGFEAKLAARPAVRAQAGGRWSLRFAVWREPIVAWLDRAQQARAQARAREVLQRIEAEKLRAEGMEQKEADERGGSAAELMVEKAAELKKSSFTVRAVLQAAEKPPRSLPRSPGYLAQKIADSLFGPKVRFVVGALLIVAAGLWARGQIAAGEIAPAVGSSEEAAGSMESLLGRGHPVQLPGVGSVRWCDNLNPLVAGLILMLSTLYPRPGGLALQVTGAAVALGAHRLGIPPVGSFEPHQLTMVVGVALAAAGVFVSRRN